MIRRLIINAFLTGLFIETLYFYPKILSYLINR